MRISIITPSFNQAPFLEKTIRSVLTQDYPDIEYLIMDGGSTDGSIDIIRQYESQLAGWVSETDQGQTDAINKGFNRATGDILAWINSDDTYEPGAVSEAMNYLVDQPEVGLVYGDANFIDEQDEVIGTFNARQADYQRLMQGAVYIPQQATFFRASLWQKIGPLDPAFYFAMDYDLWIRLAKITSFKYLPGKTWANFRLHSAAKSIAEDARCWPEMLKVHQREGGSYFSIMRARYLTRRLLAPVLMYRRRKMFSS